MENNRYETELTPASSLAILLEKPTDLIKTVGR